MSHLNQPPAVPQSPSATHDAAQPSIQHVGDSVTTGTLPVVTPASRGPVHTRPVREPLGVWLGVVGVVAVLGGALAGVLWKLLVPLTTWSVSPDGGASTTERGLADYIAGDAWFAAIGLGCGVLVGLLAWRWFSGLGWPVVAIGVVVSLVMALACWQMGWWLGPGAFEPRLAAAKPGDVLPIELTLRTPVVLLCWPFGAVLPLMLLSSLLRDPEVSPPGRTTSPARAKAAAAARPEPVERTGWRHRSH